MQILIIGNNIFYPNSYKQFFKKNKKVKILYFNDNDFKKRGIIKKIKKMKINYAVVFSGLSGGIFYNIKNSKEILNYNINAYLQIFSILKKCNLKNIFFISASCVYPKDKEKISEKNFLDHGLEETSLAYSASKMIGTLCCFKANFENKNFKWMTIIPATIYGQKISKKDTDNMHVINAMISKFKFSTKKVVFYGNGEVKREFIHIHDLIDAIHFIHNNKIFNPIINVGSNYDIKIKDLCKLISNISNFKGEIEWKKSKYIGTKKKLLNMNYLNARGWKNKISLGKGLERVIKNH